MTDPNYLASCAIHRDLEARKRQMAPILAEQRRVEREQAEAYRKAAKRRKLDRRRKYRRGTFRAVYLKALWWAGWRRP